MATNSVTINLEELPAPKRWPRRNSITVLKNIRRHFQEYTRHSSLHGVQYLGDKKRRMCEKLIFISLLPEEATVPLEFEVVTDFRFFWLMVICCSIMWCGISIGKAYKKWRTSPVMVNFASKPIPIWHIPFPAVTVCPETKVMRSIFNYSNTINKYRKDENMTDWELEMLRKVSLVCSTGLLSDPKTVADYDVKDFLKKINKPMRKVVATVMWQGDYKQSSAFSPTFTEEGQCFTFNMLNDEDFFTPDYRSGRPIPKETQAVNWSYELGYHPRAARNTYPRRTMWTGQNSGLSVTLLAFRNDFDYICNTPEQGFKVVLHHPAEVPKIDEGYFKASLNQQLVVTVEPELVTTSQELTTYDPNYRGCYFSYERKLKYYNIYTQKNCEMECLTNLTMALCNCVAFFMPHNNFTPVCTVDKKWCIYTAKEALIWDMEMTLDKTTAQNDPFYTKSESVLNQKCNCLPACTTVTFYNEITQTDLNWNKFLESLDVNQSILNYAYATKIFIHYKYLQNNHLVRNELFGYNDFLANCGGLLGVFMGFSFLSVIEIIYFFSLRIFCNVRQHGCRSWAGVDKNDSKCKC